MKNNLIDLNNHLFAQIERLGDENITNKELSKEIDRSKAVTQISNQIIKNAALCLQAKKLKIEYGTNKKMPEMIEDKQNA